VELQQKRPFLINRKDVIFHHIRRQRRTAKQTLQKPEGVKMGNPPASIFSFAPSDFHLFRSLQNSLNEKNFGSEDAVDAENCRKHLTIFFDGKPRNFYKKGIYKLIKCWQTIVENNGDYIVD